jgi:hypothetical protein
MNRKFSYFLSLLLAIALVIYMGSGIGSTGMKALAQQPGSEFCKVQKLSTVLESVPARSSGAQWRVWYEKDTPEQKALAKKLLREINTNIRPALVNRVGMKKPLSDAQVRCKGLDGALDIYLVDAPTLAAMGREGSLGGTIYADPSNAKPAPAAIVLLSSLPFDEAKTALAHEFMHASQAAYQLARKADTYYWLSESTAEWARDAVYPDSQFEQRGRNVFLDSTVVPINTVEYGADGKRDPKRPYATYLFFQYLARKHSPALVGKIWKLAERKPQLVAVNAAIPGGFKQQWAEFAKTLYNDEPIKSKPDSFFAWDNFEQRPGEIKIDGNLGGKPENEESQMQSLENLSTVYYHFDFKDENTRSVLFHNTFYENVKKGEPVSVQALWKAENQDWMEEEWTQANQAKEWIGFCRDRKAQRLEQLVLIVSSAKFRNPGNPIKAAAAPTFKASNLGCWGYQGKGEGVYPLGDSGQITAKLTDARYEFQPQVTQDKLLRYTDQVPLLKSGTYSQVEDHRIGQCSITGTYGPISSPEKLIGQLYINLFNEVFPPANRANFEKVTGSKPRGYYMVGAPISEPFDVKVTCDDGKTSSQPSATTAAFFTNVELQEPYPIAENNGNLQGSFVLPDTVTYTWEFSPIREP